MNIPEVHEEQVAIPTLGTKKVEWLSRSVMSKNEINHNLVLHIYHVEDPAFPKMMEQAWVRSGIMDQNVTCELSYTDGIGDFKIDAYDAIFFKVDPTHAKAYKDLFIRALQALYQEQQDASARDAGSDARRHEIHGTDRAKVSKMQQNSNRQDGPQEE